MSTDARIELRFESGGARVSRALERLCRVIAAAGGRALAVGGCVRDAALGVAAKDFDLEVYGIEPLQLEELLARHFAIDRVGKSFGVLKIKGLPIDVALPRRESKAGLGHRAFEVLSDPRMSTEEAQSRRDFTINAVYLDPITDEVIDHYGGLRDLAARVLRHTSEKFSEDPLRVLRGMQFAARFDLTAAEETIALCRTIQPEGLAAERLWEEWKKLVLSGARPSRGLGFLRDSGWVRYFPELEALIGCAQDPRWHPEGDVWTHTLRCMDAFAAERSGDPWEDLVVGFAVLCHDLGKPATTETEGGRVRSLGHEAAGESPTRSFLERLTNQRELAEQVVPLVVEHLQPALLFKAEAGDAAIRRLARRVGRIDRLVRVARADHLGRDPAGAGGPVFPAGDWLLARAAALDVTDAAPRPIVQGRHLIELGLSPGPHFKALLDACFEAQLAGRIGTVDEGKALARELADHKVAEPGTDA
jgi:tRNA nucleotidyltransferase (CCA-adding enzyme)